MTQDARASSSSALVYNQADCKKPVKRLWISSMEESAIREGFENLKDGGEYDNLYQSALCRLWADWLVGINATSAFFSAVPQNLEYRQGADADAGAALRQAQQNILFPKGKVFYRRPLT